MRLNTRDLQRIALRLVGWLPKRTQAVWLTTMYELHRVFYRGQCEPWLQTHVSNAYRQRRWRRILPLSAWLRVHGALYCLRLHRQGHVLPGVRKILGMDDVGVSSGLPSEAFPSWMQDDLRQISEIDASLCPSAGFFARFHAWQPDADTTQGELLTAAWNALDQQRYDVVVIAPWVRTGGADKGLAQYCQYYISRGLKVALLTTYPGESTRLETVHPEVKIAELGLKWRQLRMDEQIGLLARLLLLLRPRLVHNCLSELAWRCYATHGLALRSTRIVLAASLYAEDVTAKGCRVGYAVDFLPQCRRVLDVLLTDSWPWAQRFRDHYALTRSDIAAVHFFVPDAMLAPDYSSLAKITEVSPNVKPVVLWAGRLCAQKRPDLLFEIAKTMPEVTFEVYGPVEHEAVSWEHRLKRLANVLMGGEFRNFHELVMGRNYTALLYTTSFDGMPNILLEAAAEQLPIVAPPTVGGLAELVDENTAFCVTDAQNPSDYVQALQRALANPELAKQKTVQAKGRLAEKFSRETFEKDMGSLLNRWLDCPMDDAV